MKKRFNTYYGMVIYDEYEDGFAFTSTGRWTFENNLIYMSTWLHNQSGHQCYYYKTNVDTVNINQDVIDLAKMMAAHDLCVNINFTDEECGNRVLYKMQGKIIPSVHPTPGAFSLEFIVLDECNYAYTRENLIDLEVYDNNNFNISVDDVVAVLGEDRQAEIEAYLNGKPFVDDIDEVISFWSGWNGSTYLRRMWTYSRMFRRTYSPNNWKSTREAGKESTNTKQIRSINEKLQARSDFWGMCNEQNEIVEMIFEFVDWLCRCSCSGCNNSICIV